MSKKPKLPKNNIWSDIGSLDEDLTLAVLTRNIYLIGDIESKNTLKIVKQLHFLDHLGKDPIRLYLSSEGGYVPDARVIINTINNMKNATVDIIGTGSIESAASDILMFGPKGHRWMTPGSYLMLHSQYSEWDDKPSRRIKQNRMKWEDDMEDEDLDKTAKLLGWSKTKLLNKVVNEWYIFADEAKELNLIDGIWK
jgi:ATP-dependent protease ClpP protease subunit